MKNRLQYQDRRAFPESETNFSSSLSGLFGTGITVSECVGTGSCLAFAFFLFEMDVRLGRGGGAEDGLVFTARD